VRPAAPALDALEPCALVDAAEIAAVQGEPPREAKPSRRASGGLLRLACVHMLPTFARSISVELTLPTAAGGVGGAARELWQRSFHGSVEPERRAGGAAEAEAREERSAPATPVAGVGEEAFWVGGQLMGALYALCGDAFLRLGVGGSEPPETKLERATTLAHAALARLGCSAAGEPEAAAPATPSADRSRP
jgi:hypothetical protein